MGFKGINWNEQFPVALSLGKEGKSLQEIGQHFGVSRQRMKQIFTRFGVDPQEIGVKLQVRQRAHELAAAHWNKWGDKKDTDEYQLQRKRYRAKKSNATRFGVPFTIPFSELDWPTHCPVLGIELDYYAETKQENSPTFDRVIPEKGYVSGNTFIISARANRIKNDGTLEEHKLIVNFIEKACTK